MSYKDKTEQVIEALTRSRAMKVELPEPVGWYLLTGHGNSFATERPQCLLQSSWKAAYTADQLRLAVTQAVAAAEAERDHARAELAKVRELLREAAPFIGWTGAPDGLADRCYMASRTSDEFAALAKKD